MTLARLANVFPLGANGGAKEAGWPRLSRRGHASTSGNADVSRRRLEVCRVMRRRESSNVPAHRSVFSAPSSMVKPASKAARKCAGSAAAGHPPHHRRRPSGLEMHGERVLINCVREHSAFVPPLVITGEIDALIAVWTPFWRVTRGSLIGVGS